MNPNKTISSAGWLVAPECRALTSPLLADGEKKLKDGENIHRRVKFIPRCMD
jgi:hypothetical protein